MNKPIIKSHSELKKEFVSIRDDLSEDDRTRLHRALSWLECSEKYIDDADIAFMTYWTSLEACYSTTKANPNWQKIEDRT
jgi:hypothetical protein